MFLLQQNQRLENRCATYELQVQRLEAELQRLKKLELEVAELRERLGQNSQNSSKPPSSDPPSVSRPNNRQPSGGKRGGQLGHQGRVRKLLAPEEVDTIIELRPTACLQCGHLLMGNDPDPARHQVSEIPPVKAKVTEYQQQRKSFGTQSESGSRFVERILTAITSLRQQGRDVLEYLTAACRAALGQPSACCLLPNSS
jgi:phage shock protein A